jgi:hypothetical protein
MIDQQTHIVDQEEKLKANIAFAIRDLMNFYRCEKNVWYDFECKMLIHDKGCNFTKAALTRTVVDDGIC